MTRHPSGALDSLVPERMRTGTEDNRSSAFMRASSSTPDITGISRSRTTRADYVRATHTIESLFSVARLGDGNSGTAQNFVDDFSTVGVVVHDQDTSWFNWAQSGLRSFTSTSN